MINWKRVSELFDDFGEDGFAEVAEVFVTEANESLERLKAADTHDEMRAEFHFLKGAAVTLGFDELAELCAEGETLAEMKQECKLQKQQVINQLPVTCAVFLDQWRARIVAGPSG